MIKKIYENDSHFLARVSLEIVPNKKFNFTKIIANVDRLDPNENYTWWVTIPFCTTDIDKAFEEIKKDEYLNEGYSEC